MQLHVGPTAYTVLLSDRSIYDADGSELEGCVIEFRRLIVLSPIVEPHRREEVAAHEYYHAWLFHVPRPSDEESAAQLHALVAQQFRQDMEAAGGVGALSKLEPRPVMIGKPVHRPDKRAPEVRLAPEPHRCHVCDSIVLSCEFNTARPEFHEPTCKHRVERWAGCEQCGALHVWWEWAAPDGTPTGEMCAVPQSKVLRGREASAWLAAKSQEVVKL